MKTTLSLLVFFTYLISYAQMGVGTTSPDASAQLDISANDKGVLVPRISLSNVTQTTLDGSNTAATGLLIWNTNASTDGGNGVGFYFFNGVQWMPITQTSSADHDMYEVGGTNPPDAITDHKYTQGSITIGTNSTATGVLDIDNATKATSLDINNTFSAIPTGINLNITTNSSGKTGLKTEFNGTYEYGSNSFVSNTDNLIGNTSRTAIANDFNGTSSSISTSITGVKNDFKSTSSYYGILYGMNNLFSSNANSWSYGVANTFSSSGSNPSYGVVNTFDGTSTGTAMGLINTSYDYYGGIVGVKNQFTGYGNGVHYGVLTTLSGTGSGDKYGNSIYIADAAGGTHYGFYSIVLKSGSYAGYFLGNVSIGTTTTNNYILPQSRGANGQIMQTDGSGNVSWVTPTSIDNQQIDVLSLTGDTLNISLQDDGVATQTLNLASIDNQATDVFSLSGDILSLSLQDDGVATQTLNLASIDNQATDVFSISGDVLSLSLQNDGVATQTLNLASIDNQATDVFSLSGDILSLSLQDDGVATQTLDLSSLDNQTIDVLSITGDQLNLSLQDDGTATQTLDLSSIDNQTVDELSLTANTLSLSLQNDGMSATTLDLSPLKDHDWYEENTTSPADAITDDIYTNGNVGIGVSNVQYPLQISSSSASRNLNINNTSNGSSIYSICNNILESSASTGNTVGLLNIISRTGQSSIVGVANSFSNAEATVGYGYLYGYDNSFSSTTSLQSVGLINRFQGTTTSGYGVKNLMSGTATNYYGLSNYNLTSENVTATIYGVHNDLNGIGNGSRYGVYTNFTETGGGAKYGEYIHIASGAGGTHYGIYADVTKATGYAGYFLGRVAIGSLSTNTYILPSSRGTNGQIMQTDGSGVISWVSPPSTDHDWYEVGGTSSPNSITDNIYTQGNVAIGKNTIASDTKVDVENTDKTTTLTLNNTYDEPLSTSSKYGIINTLQSTEYQIGIQTNLLGNAPTKQGYSAVFEDEMTNIGVGFDSRFETSGAGNQFGMYNTFASTTNTGNIWGIRNWYLSTSGYTGTLYGISNDFYNNNNGTHTAVNNLFAGTGSGTKYGVKNTFSGTSSGIFYGSYTDVTNIGFGTKYGAYNNFNTNGVHYGIYNNLVSIGGLAVGYGVYNKINNTGGSVGAHYGMYNEMLAFDNQYGVYTTMPNGTNYDQYGNYVTIAGTGTGNRYGFYSTINSSAGGTHYGVYSNATKAGSYAGYFLGNVSIGTSIGNEYILPDSRGTNGQIMRTDGSGNVSWVNQTVDTDTDNQTIDELSLTGDTLNISLQDDGVATQTLNLSAIDNQTIDLFSLSGTVLNLSLQNDGMATQTVSLASLANDWKITGNTGTLSGTNFIGTTDAQDLDFRTNNVVKLKLTQQGQLSFQNTGGSVFVGAGAGSADDLSANQNTFVGTNAGNLVTTGNLNTAIGHFALDANVDGFGNTAIGKGTLNANVSGYNNTALGRLADVSSDPLNNATVIGFNASVNASNKIRLGNSSVTVIEGQVAYSFPSDARFKFNVQENVPGLDFISRLKPVTYQFDTQKFDAYINPKSVDNDAQMDYQKSMSLTHSGFLAQDVEQICKDLGYEFDGLHIPDASNPYDNYSVSYSQFIMPLVKAVQEQQEQIVNDQLKIESLQKIVEEQQTKLERLNDLESRISKLEDK